MPDARDAHDRPVRLLGEPWGDASRLGRPFAKDPSVVRFGDRFLLYFSLPPWPSDPEAGWDIGIAESDDLVHWTTLAALGRIGDADAAGRAAPGAVVLDGRVHLFFQSYGTGPGDAICHAVSDDGVIFAPNPENPVFSPTGDWTVGRAIDADVVVADDRLLMAWATRDPMMRRQMVGTAEANVDSNFGRDAWTQLSVEGPGLAPELDWERDCIEAPALVYRHGRFTMFYAGGYNNEPQQIGWAWSDDGVRWERGSDTPLIPVGAAGTWNSSESGHPGVLVDGHRTVLFFQGDPDDGLTWSIAATEVRWEGDRPRTDHAD